MSAFDVLFRYTSDLFHNYKFDIFNILADIFKADLPRECVHEYCLAAVSSFYLHYVFEVALQYDSSISVGLVYDSFDCAYDSFIREVRLELYDFLENHGIRQEIIF